MRQSDNKSDVKSVAYTRKMSFRAWVEKTLQRKMSIRELVGLYEKTFSVKRSMRTYQRELKLAQGIRIERREQLYGIPMKISDIKSMVSPQNDTPLHSSHNYRYSIGYRGNQPMDGQVKPWGRYKTGFQVIYELAPGLRITAFSRRLLVMLKDPDGKTTNEQMISARAEAYLSIMRFAKDKKLELDGSVKKILGSHHVLENMGINPIIQGALHPYAQEIELRTGTLVNGDNSHPGKMEHQGGGASQLKGEEAAKGFEYLLWRFPGDFARLAQINADTAKQQALYAENIKSHLSAIQELRDYIRELRDIKRGRP